MQYFIIFYRSLFFYCLIAFGYRLMGKREIGELSIMDFIVTIFMAEVVAFSIEQPNRSILVSLIPISVLIILQMIISYISLKSNKARHIIDGYPSIIIERGKINFKEMKKQRYNLDDLLSQLREKQVKSILDVDYAILETSGKLSVFLKNQDYYPDYPLPLILDGKLDENVLLKINKDKKWLIKKLEKEEILIKNIFYAFYKNNELYIIEK